MRERPGMACCGRNLVVDCGPFWPLVEVGDPAAAAAAVAPPGLGVGVLLLLVITPKTSSLSS